MLPALVRAAARRLMPSACSASLAPSQHVASVGIISVRYSHGSSNEVSPDRAYNESRLCPPIRPESYDVLEQRLRNFFNRTDIDGWDVRRGLTEINHNDLTPEPDTIVCALHAIRRVNDHSLAVRFLENLKDQSQLSADIYPWLLDQIRPTLDELGISTPAELGYDKPELACPDAEDCDGSYPFKRAGPKNSEPWSEVVKRGGLHAAGHH